MTIFPVAVQDPLPGSYSSAVASGIIPPVPPPGTSTLPSSSSVAVLERTPLPSRVTMLPVVVQDPLPGSYSSADVPLPLSPPATSTLPSGSSVAVLPWRGVVMLPVAVQVRVLGSYSSAEASEPLPLPPPATSTLPSSSSVAVSA